MHVHLHGGRGVQGVGQGCRGGGGGGGGVRGVQMDYSLNK